MNLQNAIEELAFPESLPASAITYLRENWGDVVEDLLGRLEKFVSGEDRSDIATESLLAILYLFAEHRETRAFKNMCRLLTLGEKTNYVLGDALTEHYTSMLISTFDGDGSAMRAVVESEEVDEWPRAMAFQAMAYLVASGQYPDFDMPVYLFEWDAKQPRTKSCLWTTWAMVIAWFGLKQFVPLVQSAYQDGRIDAMSVTEEEVLILLELSACDPNPMAGFMVDRIGPFSNAIDALRMWYWKPSMPSALDKPREPGTRKIGRNERCPCGSGKKYKACCMKGA